MLNWSVNRQKMRQGKSQYGLHTRDEELIVSSCFEWQPAESMQELSGIFRFACLEKGLSS